MAAIDGITLQITTGAISAILGSGATAAIMSYLYRRKERNHSGVACCVDCPEHKDVVERITALEKNDAAKTAILTAIKEDMSEIKDLLFRAVMKQ